MALSIPKIQLAAAIVVCLSVASQAGATDEPAYVGAGANAGPPSATLPQSVQVIDANTIATSGAQSIADLLRIVPDANPGSSRIAAFQSESLSVRGSSAGQIRNGMRQHHYAETDSSALSNIERIEVMKGPSGVLYGPSGLGGVLHIITRQPDGQFGAQLWAALGSHAQKVIAGDFRVPVSEQLGLRVTGQIERSGTFVDHDNIDRENLAFTLRYVFSDRATAHLVAEYVERRTQYYPGLPVEGTVAPNGAAPLSRGLYLGEPSDDELAVHAPLLQAWAEIRLNDRWTLIPRLQYQGFTSDFTQIRLRGAQADRTTINRDGRSGQQDDANALAQLDLSGSFATGAIEHRLLAGYEYDHERGRLTQYNLTNVTPIGALNPAYAFALNGPNRSFAFDRHRDLDGSALYLQDQLALASRWSVTGSVRHSWLEQWSRDAGSSVRTGTDIQDTLWQLGSTFVLSDGVTLYGGYSSGFDSDTSGGQRAADGAPLEPEKSSQLEAGLRLSQGALRGSLSAFQIKRSDTLTADPQNAGFSLSAGAQRVRGIEVQGDWQAAPLWTVSGGYALLQSKVTRSNDGDQGSRPGDVPKHSAGLRTAYEIPQYALTLRAGWSHVSDRLLTSGSSIHLRGYTLLDAGISRKVGSIDVDMALTNLADKRYFTASGNAFAVIPGDPRSVQLRLGTHW